MDLDWMFTLELLLAVVLLVGFASGVIYHWVKGRRTARMRLGSAPA